jgi:hypothetical protein
MPQARNLRAKVPARLLPQSLAVSLNKHEARRTELALAHAVKGDAEAAYCRDDALEKRRPMMDAWGRFCLPKTAKVIPFTAA